MNVNIVLLPGDGIGTEVVAVAREVLDRIGEIYGHNFSMSEFLVGGCAIDKTGIPLPEETLTACKSADAVLLGAVGGPKWDDPRAIVRPEQGLLGLRKGLELFANLRPIQPNKELLDASPLKKENISGVDFIVVRELTGGIYYGEPRVRQEVDGSIQALDTMVYSEPEIVRVAELAFELARNRKRKVTSVDKSNVLESSRLWRETVTKVAEQHPDITFENLLVDATAMHLITRPADFDVIVTANLFGDILTDEASVLTGSLGNLPSASLGENKNGVGFLRGLYEPIHGSAPDIAGKGIANPIGAVISAALLLRYSLGLEEEAKAVERAVNRTLEQGYRTADIANPGQKAISTSSIKEIILSQLQ